LLEDLLFFAVLLAGLFYIYSQLAEGLNDQDRRYKKLKSQMKMTLGGAPEMSPGPSPQGKQNYQENHSQA